MALQVEVGCVGVRECGGCWQSRVTCVLFGLAFLFSLAKKEVGSFSFSLLFSLFFYLFLLGQKASGTGYPSFPSTFTPSSSSGPKGDSLPLLFIISSSFFFFTQLVYSTRHPWGHAT